MKAKTELIVLSHTDFKENMIVLHTLSKEYGRRGFLVRIGRKSGMSLFLPLNILEAEITESNKSELWFASSFIATEPLFGVRDNIYKNTMTLFMSEVLFRTVKDGTNEDGLFDWCRKQILTLNAIQSDFSNFHIRFLLEFCVALGFRPELEDIAPFAGNHLEEIGKMMRLSFGESMLMPLSGESRNEIAGLIIKYLEFHTESAINVRSLAVLRDIYK